MFQKKKTQEKRQYNSEQQRPAIKSGICSGERVARFVDRRSGKFEDIMLLRSEQDLEVFCQQYGIRAEEIEKIWQ